MKYLKKIILIALVFPLLALAADDAPQNKGFLDSGLLKAECMTDGKCQLADVAQGLILLIRYLLGVMGAVALLYFVIGGFHWVTSQGNQERVRKGKEIMKNTVFALVIAFTSYLALDFFVNKILNVDTDYRITGTQGNIATNPTTGECAGKAVGTACNTSAVNYVCSGAEFQDKCVTECDLKNLVDKNILIANNLNWSCATSVVGNWQITGLCPAPIDNVCTLYWKNLPVTSANFPPLLGDTIDISEITF